VTVTENVIRGGVVMENPDLPANPTLPTQCTVGVACPCQGDLDDDGWRSPDDLSILVGILSPHGATGYWVENTAGHCGDMDGDGWLSPDDLSILVGILSPHSGTGYWVQCP
jgi:hypothetical protein